MSQQMQGNVEAMRCLIRVPNLGHVALHVQFILFLISPTTGALFTWVSFDFSLAIVVFIRAPLEMGFFFRIVHL